MNFPVVRMRRLRRTPAMRSMVRETRLSVQQLVHPLFVTAESGVKREVPSMPGCFQLSIENLTAEVEEIAGLGIPAVLLFGLPASKDPEGSEAYADDGVIHTLLMDQSP